MTSTKQCPKCREVKPFDGFYKNKGRKNGLASVCIPCGRAYRAASCRANPECGRAAAVLFRSTAPGRINSMLQGARARSRADALPCTITRDWVAERVNSGRCAVTGIPFNLEKDGRGRGYRNPFIPSLDQILPNRGYTPENTQVVVWMYNAAKGAGSHEDVLKFVEAFRHVE